MMAARAFLRKSLNPLKEPGEVLARLNKELAKNNERCMFVTLVLGIMDSGNWCCIPVQCRP